MLCHKVSNYPPPSLLDKNRDLFPETTSTQVQQVEAKKVLAFQY